jgi:MFS family permease
MAYIQEVLTLSSHRAAVGDVWQIAIIPWLQLLVHHLHHRCGSCDEHAPIHRVPIFHGLYVHLMSFTRYMLTCAGFGGAPLVLGGGTIADLVPRQQRGTAMAIWVMGPTIGPCVGPLIGGFLTVAKGWRWNFWFVAIVVRTLTHRPLL